MLENGIRSSADALYKQQMKFVEDWKPSSDTRFLRYGSMALAALTSASGAVVTAHYRSRLKLRSLGLMSSYLPLTMIPAASAGVLHHGFVTRNLLLLDTPCPVCLNLRAIGFQLGMSIVTTVVMATISNFHLAERRMTYPLPTLSEDPRTLLAIWKKLSRPLARPLAILAVANTILAAGVTHMEAAEYFSMLDKTLEQDEEKKRERDLAAKMDAAEKVQR